MNVVSLNTELQFDDVDLGTMVKSAMISGYQILNQGLDVIAFQMQNQAFAQTSDQAYLPNLAGAPTAQFSAALVCPAAGPGALGAYCKYCDPLINSMQNCIRLRICLNPAGCNPATNDEWVRRTIGIIRR